MAEEKDKYSDNDYAKFFSAPVEEPAPHSDEEYAKFFSAEPGQPKAAEGPVKQLTGWKREVQLPLEALATGTQHLITQRGDINSMLPESFQAGNPKNLKKNANGLSDFLDTNLPETFKNWYNAPPPSGADIAKVTGLGLENRPDLTPQSARERYEVVGVAALPQIPQLMMTGTAALPALTATLGGAFLAQGAHDVFPNSKIAPIAGGIVGSILGGWGGGAVKVKLDLRDATKELNDAQQGLSQAIENAEKLRANKASNNLQLGYQATLDKHQSRMAADQIIKDSEASLAATQKVGEQTLQKATQATEDSFKRTGSLLGKAADYEDAGVALQAGGNGWLKAMPGQLKKLGKELEAVIPEDAPLTLKNLRGYLGELNKNAGTLQPVADVVRPELVKRLSDAVAKMDARAGAAEELGMAGNSPTATWKDGRVLRTMIGDMLADPSTIRGMSQQQVAGIYRALHEDLSEVARRIDQNGALRAAESGTPLTAPSAVETWNNYNTKTSRLYDIASGPMAEITTTGKEGLKPGQVAKKLITDGATDSTTLRILREEIPDSLNELAAAHLKTQGSAGWTSLSQKSKDALVTGDSEVSGKLLDRMLEERAELQARTQAKLAEETEAHAAMVSSANEGAQAGNFKIAKKLQETRIAKSREMEAARAAEREAKKRVAEAQAKVPEKPDSAQSLAGTIRAWGAPLLAAMEGPAIANALRINHLMPGVGTALGGAILGGKALKAGVTALMERPSRVVVPLAGATSGQNALSIPAGK